MKLSELTEGRDNNFNLIRITAALAVLVTHTFAVTIGTSDAEPLRDSLGMTMGSIAVDIFFITSGFLVTGSLLTRQSVVEFMWARFLRIVPALLIMTVLTVFGLGVIFTSLPLSSYLADSTTYIYLLKCASLITGVAFTLPGVFQGNPMHDMVNASLWTMPQEIRMYAILLLIFLVSRVIKINRIMLLKTVIIIIFAISGVLVVYSHFFLPDVVTFVNLLFMFFSGAAFYVLKNRIRLSYSVFWVVIIALLLSAITDKQAFFVIYLLTITYILFYVAYIPSGCIRKYNQVGDYSYGIYIYAFPVQQSVAALVPGVSVLPMLSISVPAILLLAALSWHLLERRSLGLKALCVAHTRRILSNGMRGSS
jgi:peptidoglycan/LPS O-acetylase OafA/YrhL